MSKSNPKATKSLLLRIVLAVPFVVQIFAALGPMGYLSLQVNQQHEDEIQGHSQRGRTTFATILFIPTSTYTNINERSKC